MDSSIGEQIEINESADRHPAPMSQLLPIDIRNGFTLNFSIEPPNDLKRATETINGRVKILVPDKNITVGIKKAQYDNAFFNNTIPIVLRSRFTTHHMIETLNLSLVDPYIMNNTSIIYNVFKALLMCDMDLTQYSNIYIFEVGGYTERLRLVNTNILDYQKECLYVGYVNNSLIKKEEPAPKESRLEKLMNIIAGINIILIPIACVAVIYSAFKKN